MTLLSGLSHGRQSAGTGVRPRRSLSGSPWPRYLISRLLGAAALIVVLVVVTFLIVHLVPGDPARNISGIEASPAAVRQVRVELGLERPLGVQFGDYVEHLLSGNLGTSFVTGQPVAAMIRQRLPVTAELAGLSLIIVLGIGFSAGIFVAARSRGSRRQVLGSVFTGLASLSGAAPEYIIGTALIYVFALSMHIFPVQGGTSPSAIVLPAIAVAFAPTAVFARVVRNETLSVLDQDYITAALSKRLPAWRLYLTHVVPNVITSALTLGGLLLVALLGGTVVTENVYDIPGLGTEIVQGIQQNDYPAVQGIILVLGLLAVAITFGIDVVLGLVDPRRLTTARGQ